jgi:hypothetical protein
MSTHDVSHASQFVQLLLMQKQSLQEAQSLKDQHFTAQKSRDEEILQFRF